MPEAFGGGAAVPLEGESNVEQSAAVGGTSMRRHSSADSRRMMELDPQAVGGGDQSYFFAVCDPPTNETMANTKPKSYQLPLLCTS